MRPATLRRRAKRRHTRRRTGTACALGRQRKRRAEMLNKIMLIGNLGRDPEMSYLPSGKAVTKFSVAVSRRWNDRESGERREETTWVNAGAFDRLAETCNPDLHKWPKGHVDGAMTSAHG